MPAKKKYQEPETKIQNEADTQNLIDRLYFGTAEKTEAWSSYYPDSQFAPYNPDDLFQKQSDYSIYEDMLHDDQVNVCVAIKRDLILGSGWSILSEEDDELHQMIQKDLEIAFNEDTEIPFDDQLEEIISAYNFGFSVSEKVFKHRPDGSLTLKYLKTRHPSTWLLHTDRQGNVERYEQQGIHGNVEFNPASLIHYINNPGWGNPYGTSDLRAAYTAWFTKRQIIRYYGIFIEKAASPTPVARYDKAAPPGAVTDIYNAIKKLQAKTALALPKDIEVDFLQANSNGEAFTKGINIFNMFVGRSLLIPDLLGFQGDETSGGSYALGKDQLDILFKHIERRRSTLESIVNKHIVWPIVVANHGFVDNYPKFKLNPVSDQSAIELARLWSEAVRGQLYKPSENEINRFRELVGFPTGDVDYPEPVAPSPLPFTVNGTVNHPQPVVETDKEEHFASLYGPTKGDFSRKVDFKGIKSIMDAFKERVAAEAAPVIEKIYEDLFDQLQKKRILPTQRVDKLDQLSLKHLKELKLILKRNLRQGYLDGKSLAQKELIKGTFAAPLANDKFLDFLENMAFTYVGKWATDIEESTKIAMLNAVRDGASLSEVVNKLSDIDKKRSKVSLERFARTTFTDVMNHGRKDFFDDSGVVAAYQYSAILDDRTSDICRGLHGKVFSKDKAPVPPLHFNCRSVLIPITKFEDWKADDKVGKQNIDTFIKNELNKTGFSKE